MVKTIPCIEPELKKLVQALGLDPPNNLKKAIKMTVHYHLHDKNHLSFLRGY